MSTTRPRPDLSRERIVSEALAFVDESGIDACSVRALGARLGVTPMSIYWHLKNKEALLDAVLDLVLASVSADGLPADPVDALAEVGRRYRAAFAAHPNVAPLLASRPTPQGPAGQALMAGAIALLQAAGFDERNAAAAYALVSQFVMGTVITEHEQERHLPPLLVRFGISDIPDPAERFEFGLAVLQSGLRAQVAAQAKPQRKRAPRR